MCKVGCTVNKDQLTSFLTPRVCVTRGGEGVCVSERLRLCSVNGKRQGLVSFAGILCWIF